MNSRICLGILEFLASVALLPHNDAGNSRIPYRDPQVKLGDDIVGNSRISKLKSLGILEFLATLNKNSRIPRLNSRILKLEFLGILEFLD